MTLIVKHIVTYARPQFEISLSHPISLIVLIFFYGIQGNVSVSDQKFLISQLAEKPSYVSGTKLVGDFNSQTSCSICLTTIGSITNT